MQPTLLVSPQPQALVVRRDEIVWKQRGKATYKCRNNAEREDQIPHICDLS